MKYLGTILLGMFLYLGCGNNSKPNMASSEKAIQNALENDSIQEGWDSRSNRLELLNAIKNADKEGLFPEDYNYTALKDFEDKLLLFPENKEKYHEMLTIAYIKYVSDLRNGKINAKEIYTDWEIEHKEIQPDTLLIQALLKKRIDSTIESCKPKHPIYKDLKKILAKLTAMPKDSFTEIVTTEKLLVGKKNKVIPAIKERLKYWGDMSLTDTVAKDTYTKSMKEAVSNFQRRHGLVPDGIMGKGTLAALNVSKEERIKQVIVNLERWRWFPESLGENFLGVNLPNFLLYVVEKGDSIKSYKVVIGKDKRKTPILSSKIENIVFNPTWTVPPTIIKEDLVPDATKSRSYFSKTKLKIFNYKNQEISVSDWKPEDALKYKYVQEPGYNNSLGVVKINFNNKHSVYLHDTNHRDLFGNSYRALSSGCVRIEKPLPLAEYLLLDKTKKEKQKDKTLKTVPIYTLSEIDTIIKTKITKAVKVSKNFNVHFLYFTAWYDKGQIQFRQDVYNYDPELYLRLSNQFRSDVVTSGGVVDK